MIYNQLQGLSNVTDIRNTVDGKIAIFTDICNRDIAFSFGQYIADISKQNVEVMIDNDNGMYLFSIKGLR